ncbi:MAG: HEPN domain-containing protein [Theionarchaea archaeon]|nr:HEPN domain-containing protein [Theionarchaea archaeon]
MKSKLEARRWFKQAERTLETAKWNLKGGFYEEACFLSQQAAEKSLKAYLYSKGRRVLMTHSTFELARECMKFSKDFSDLITYCRYLDRHYLPARYPNAVPGGTPYEIYTKQDSEKSIIQAEEILKTVEMLLEEISVLEGPKKEK